MLKKKQNILIAIGIGLVVTAGIAGLVWQARVNLAWKEWGNIYSKWQQCSFKKDELESLKKDIEKFVKKYRFTPARAVAVHYLLYINYLLEEAPKKNYKLKKWGPFHTYMKAVLLEEQGKLEKAIRFFKKVSKQEPEFFKILGEYGVARCLEKKGETEQAIEIYQKLVKKAYGPWKESVQRRLAKLKTKK